MLTWFFFLQILGLNKQTLSLKEQPSSADSTNKKSKNVEYKMVYITLKGQCSGYCITTVIYCCITSLISDSRKSGANTTFKCIKTSFQNF